MNKPNIIMHKLEVTGDTKRNEHISLAVKYNLIHRFQSMTDVNKNYVKVSKT